MPFIEPLSSPSSTRPTESDRRDTGDPGEKALPPRKLASRDGAADDSGDTRPAAHDQSEAPAAKQLPFDEFTFKHSRLTARAKSADGRRRRRPREGACDDDNIRLIILIPLLLIIA